ncbi:hypothetical protein CBR_g8709 [Chara braunii]|uniref:DUF659 domain-containing protein n=1 Tax=Chara braunii TaxID=69332 RepID=A0A388KMR4_CHABU|nr:hypothetical protein CBR_g8709 [Chara braunii]|eukprot:GBG71288.1 hypothetical protein CBR_g8709 [Chara braunii]
MHTPLRWRSGGEGVRFALRHGLDVPRSGAMGGEAERPAHGVGEGEDAQRSAEGDVARDGEGAGAAEGDEADFDVEVGMAEGERTLRGEGAMPEFDPLTRQRTVDWERSYGKKPVALQQPGGGPLPVLPSHSEIASMRTVEIHCQELAEELEEVRQSFWVSGATLLSDGRKSRDGRPIMNFLTAGSRGVVMYTTINREGEPDDAVHVLERWVTIFHGFRFGGPRRVNAKCTDSASAYVGAERALASPSMPPELRRITWLPCCVHVCSKLLSDIGTICTSFVDTITSARVLVVFFKTHQAALSFFRVRNGALGLVLSCTTQFSSVYSMLERLLALKDRLQSMMTAVDERVWAWIRTHTTHDGACTLRDVLTEPPLPRCSVLLRELDQYHTWVFRQAKRYLLSQTGFDEGGARYLEICRQFEDFHLQQGRYGTWGGAEGRARARSCSGDCEMLECASWWSQYGGDAPDLQYCALHVMHMWSCASPAERNWAVHKGIHTKKCNQLAFEKVVHLVEIIANVRLMEYRCAGCGYVLPWQRDEGMLNAQAGLEVDPVRSGTRSGIAEEEIEEQAALISCDPIGSSAPPSVESVFGARATIFRPYPREDEFGDKKKTEAADDPALPIPPRERGGDLEEVGVDSGAPLMEERVRRAEEHEAAGAGEVEGIRGIAEEAAGAVEMRLSSTLEERARGADRTQVDVDDGAQVETEEAVARVHDGEQVERVEAVAGVHEGDAQVEMEEDVVTVHTARRQPGLVGVDTGRGAMREVMAVVSQSRHVRGGGEVGSTFAAALAAAAHAVRDQIPRRSGAARPRPMPATGGAALGESSGAEGLGMPRGSHRERTVAEVMQVSARLVQVRTGTDPVTVVEDDPEMEPAIEEVPEEDDEYRDDEDSVEEESDRGDDESYDDDDEPSPPPRRGSGRRCG